MTEVGRLPGLAIGGLVATKTSAKTWREHEPKSSQNRNTHTPRQQWRKSVKHLNAVMTECKRYLKPVVVVVANVVAAAAVA